MLHSSAFVEQRKFPRSKNVRKMAMKTFLLQDAFADLVEDRLLRVALRRERRKLLALGAATLASSIVYASNPSINECFMVLLPTSESISDANAPSLNPEKKESPRVSSPPQIEAARGNRFLPQLFRRHQ